MFLDASRNSFHYYTVFSICLKSVKRSNLGLVYFIFQICGMWCERKTDGRTQNTNAFNLAALFGFAQEATTQRRNDTTLRALRQDQMGMEKPLLP